MNIVGRDNPCIGIIEERVRETRLVDGALRIFKRFETNAPSFCPERRRFLAKAAAAAAGAWLARLFPEETRAREHKATATEPTTDDERGLSPPIQPNPDWKTYLLSQDLIYGPSLTIHPLNGKPNDFQNHLYIGKSFGGAVDYDCPNRTPLTPSLPGHGITRTNREGSKAIDMFSYRGKLASTYSHLYGYNANVIDTSLRKIIYTNNDNRFGLTDVVAYSGNTGNYRGRTLPHHLHWRLMEREGDGWALPGIDPFTVGVDGGRPIYYDGETSIPPYLKQNIVENLMAVTRERMKDSGTEELGLDAATYHDLITVLEREDLEDLQGFLRHQVLQKHPDSQGSLNYRFMPGSFMYGVVLKFMRKPNQEFVAMLPFINPMVVGRYRPWNSGIEL